MPELSPPAGGCGKSHAMNGTDRPPPKGPEAGTAAPGAAGAGAAGATERFDEILSRLRGVVDKLEAGNLPLEESLKFFEEGIALCRRGATILDSAERKVEVLLSSSGGTARTAPFETPSGDGD
jgi:exodeoxyribonuclease VII small subunit